MTCSSGKGAGSPTLYGHQQDAYVAFWRDRAESAGTKSSGQCAPPPNSSAELTGLFAFFSCQNDQGHTLTWTVATSWGGWTERPLEQARHFVSPQAIKPVRDSSDLRNTGGHKR